jgi:hypothetical protein
MDKASYQLGSIGSGNFAEFGTLMLKLDLDPVGVQSKPQHACVVVRVRQLTIPNLNVPSATLGPMHFCAAQCERFGEADTRETKRKPMSSIAQRDVSDRRR